MYNAVYYIQIDIFMDDMIYCIYILLISKTIEAFIHKTHWVGFDCSIFGFDDLAVYM